MFSIATATSLSVMEINLAIATRGRNLEVIHNA